MEKFKKISKVAIPVALAALPFLALAVLPLPTNPIGGTGVTLGEAEAIIRRIATFLIVISIVVAVIFIVIGAIIWVSAGTNDDLIKKGKGYIKNGIWGAAVIFLIGVILQTLAGLVTRTFFN